MPEQFEQTALATQPANTAIAPMHPVNPAQMIQLAFQKAMESSGAEALAVADRILEQMAKQRDYDDRERYNSALMRIQSKLGVVVKASITAPTASTIMRYFKTILRNSGRGLCENFAMNGNPTLPENI